MDMQFSDLPGLKVLPIITEADSTTGGSSANAKVEEKSALATIEAIRTAFAEEKPGDAVRPPGVIAASKAKIVVKALRAMEDSIKNMIRLLEEDVPMDALTISALTSVRAVHELEMAAARADAADGRVVEGVFDGVRMVGSDGKAYPVPPNYASKSKLVEGDLLKLTIGPRGNFIFKQTGPIERGREIGGLGFDQTIGEYYVAGADKRWNVLKASVTYFKGEPGDEAVVLVPKDAPAKWAAVENIIKKNPLI